MMNVWSMFDRPAGSTAGLLWLWLLVSALVVDPSVVRLVAADNDDGADDDANRDDDAASDDDNGYYNKYNKYNYNGNCNKNYVNVFGDCLSACSYDGSALAGHDNTAYCQDNYAATHRVCVNVADLGGSYSAFCDPNVDDDATKKYGCSATLPCHDDASAECEINNYCVDQYEFATYVKSTSDCQNLNLYCDAISADAIRDWQAYTKAHNSKKYLNALYCVRDRCGIDLHDSSLYDAKFLQHDHFNAFFGTLFLVASVAVAAVGYLQFRRSVRKQQQKHIDGSSSHDVAPETGYVMS